jgi:hypothetical protein
MRKPRKRVKVEAEIKPFEKDALDRFGQRNEFASDEAFYGMVLALGIAELAKIEARGKDVQAVLRTASSMERTDDEDDDDASVATVRSRTVDFDEMEQLMRVDELLEDAKREMESVQREIREVSPYRSTRRRRARS